MPGEQTVQAIVWVLRIEAFDAVAASHCLPASAGWLGVRDAFEEHELGCSPLFSQSLTGILVPYIVIPMQDR